MPRRPFRMSVIRPDGTPRARARRLALRPRAFSSRFNRRPGCAIGGMFLALVIVHDLDLVRVALAELEADPPRSVHGHRPLTPALTLELVQPNAPERAEIRESLGDIEREQQIDGSLAIQPAEPVRTRLWRLILLRRST